MLHKLSDLPRGTKKVILICVDFILLYWALWSAFFIRLEQWWPRVLQENWQALALAPLLALPMFFYLGLYNAVIRFLAPRFMITIVKATSLSTLMLFVIVTMGILQNVPRSVYVIYWFLATMLIGGVRMVVREVLPTGQDPDCEKKRVIVYGAGAAGTQTARALMTSPEYRPVAFVDDKKEIQGWEILGIKVFSPIQITSLIKKMNVQEVVLSIPSASRNRRKQIIDSLAPLAVVVKTLPGMAEILDGQVRIDDIRAVDIEDLLGRDPVAPDDALMDACIAGKSVLVSGAGGSIGSELCRQILLRKPKRLVLFELSEYSLYAIDRELGGLEHQTEIVPILGSVQDKALAMSTLARYEVQTIYHAAAYKHVPIVEGNVGAGIDNNVYGTLQMALAAISLKVETFILISTDKAVRPTSVMGASKRFAELILQGLSQSGSATRFTMVRFGNVLGSSGSVVPLFRKQIREGGPVTVTHPEMTRYFMTIPEAAQLVIQAGSMGHGGDVFLLDMGKPVKIMDLARKMIHLSGLTVQDEDGGDGDVSIRVSGIRPGEKLYEELLIGDKSFETDHPRIRRAEEESMSWDQIKVLLAQFRKVLDEHDETGIRTVLQKAVTSYRPNKGDNDTGGFRVIPMARAESETKVLKTAPT